MDEKIMQLDETLKQKYLKKSLIFEASLGFFAVVFGYMTNSNPLMQIKIEMLDVLYGLLFCLPILPMFLIISYIPWEPFVQINKKLDETLLPLFRDFSWVDIALVSLLAGVCEELMFRGWLEGLGREYLGILGSAIVVNILFGLAHFITPMYALFAVFMGGILSFAVWFTDNLLVAIIMHAVYDFFALGWYLNFKSQPKAQV